MVPIAAASGWAGGRDPAARETGGPALGAGTSRAAWPLSGQTRAALGRKCGQNVAYASKSPCNGSVGQLGK